MAYDTSPAGIKTGMARQDASIADAKAGSPKGTSGTYSDAKNAAEPNEGTIARNEINKPGGPLPAGSTSDTGRMKP